MIHYLFEYKGASVSSLAIIVFSAIVFLFSVMIYVVHPNRINQ